MQPIYKHFTPSEIMRLEQENPSKILKCNADNGDTEAQYRYGVMLLEGRGIKRDFNAAIRYLGMAATKDHGGAQKSIDKVRNKFEKLCSIAVAFDRLHGKGAVTMAKLPVELQFAIVQVIMADKEGGGAESVTITHCDVTEALQDLLSFIYPDCPALGTLEAYLEQIHDLLTEGVMQYNQKENTSIGLVTQAVKLIELPEELWKGIEHHYTSIIHLGRISRSYQKKYDSNDWWQCRLKKGSPSAKVKFLMCPMFREEKYFASDEKGIYVLAKHGISDPIWIQKIRNGQLTTEEIKTALEKEGWTTDPNVGERETEMLDQQPWIKNRLIDQTLNPKQLASITDAGYQALCNPEIQRFLEQKENWRYIAQVVCYGPESSKALKNAWVREQINFKRATFKDLAQITWKYCKTVCHPKVQSFLEQKDNRKYIAMLCQSMPTVEAFCNPEIICFFEEENWPYIGQILTQQRLEKFLNEAWIRVQLRGERLTFQQLFEVTEGGDRVLHNSKMRDFLGQKQNRQYMGQFINCSNAVAELMEDSWVIDRFAEEMLTFTQLAKIGWAAKVALHRPKIQHFLMKEGNWQYIDQIIDLPSYGSKYDSEELKRALSNDWIIDQVINKTLSFQQLVYATQGGNIALEDSQIQVIFGQEDNRQYTGQVIACSNAVLGALKNVWAREQLAKKMLCYPQLAGMALAATHAVCDQTIQHFLMKEGNWQYIDQVLNWTNPRALSALQDDWVRNRIAEGKLTLGQVGDITEGGCLALLFNKGVRDFLQQDENQQYIDQVVKFSQASVNALEIVWIRDLIIEQLTIWKEWFDVPQGAFVIFNPWIRDRIAEGKVTLKGLAEMTRRGGLALLFDEEIRNFLQIDENLRYIFFIVGFSQEIAKEFPDKITWIKSRMIDQYPTWVNYFENLL